MKKYLNLGVLILTIAFISVAVGFYVGVQQRGLFVETNLPPVSGVKAESSDEDIAPLNLNTASAAELQTLPGIGKKLAQTIVDHRTEYGNFHSIWELEAVKGIGFQTIEKLAPYLYVE